MQTTANSDHLIRSEVWANELKELLLDDLMAQGWVNWLTEFPDGTTFTIPIIGEATVQDVVEDEGITYEALDTGEFQFTITEYIGSAHYITRKMLQDSFYAQEVLNSFVPKERRAIAEHVETNILALQSQQTASDLNTINGGNHRFVGGGTNETIEVADFARAKYALNRANVPLTNLVGVVDPSVAFALETQGAVTGLLSPQMLWERVVQEGISTGMRFIGSLYGFDIYESNYLADANETINGLTTTAGKANMFFSAEKSVLPFVGAWRQTPIVDSGFNKEKQREEYITTSRYGTKLYRPENLVCILTDTDQVA